MQPDYVQTAASLAVRGEIVGRRVQSADMTNNGLHEVFVSGFAVLLVLLIPIALNLGSVPDSQAGRWQARSRLGFGMFIVWIETAVLVQLAYLPTNDSKAKIGMLTLLTILGLFTTLATACAVILSRVADTAIGLKPGVTTSLRQDVEQAAAAFGLVIVPLLIFACRMLNPAILWCLMLAGAGVVGSVVIVATGVRARRRPGASPAVRSSRDSRVSCAAAKASSHDMERLWLDALGSAMWPQAQSSPRPPST